MLCSLPYPPNDVSKDLDHGEPLFRDQRHARSPRSNRAVPAHPHRPNGTAGRPPPVTVSAFGDLPSPGGTARRVNPLMRHSFRVANTVIVAPIGIRTYVLQLG